MNILKPGDLIDCHIASGLIINKKNHQDYSEIKTFEIIGTNEHGYYVFVPNYFFIKNLIKITPHLCKSSNISSKYIGENGLHILSNLIYKINSIMDGITCEICKEFHHQSAPNQSDDTFICWSCRQNNYK